MKKNIRRLAACLLGVFLLLVGGAVLIALFFGRASAPSATASPNGYDDLVKAGQAIRGKPYNAQDMELGELRALIMTNAEALRLLRTGLAHHCTLPTDDLIINFSNATVGMVALKTDARLLTAEGRLAELEQRPGDAIRSYVDAIRLGSEMSRGGFLIHRLVGVACEGLGSAPLVKLLPKLSCEEARPIAAELQEIDDSAVPWREVIQCENRFVRYNLGKYPNPIKLVFELWRDRNERRFSEERHELATARLRLLVVETALRAYGCEHANGPADLAELVPKYLKHLPQDPFSDHLFTYRQTGTNWVLYSFGPDKTDDGGKPMGKNRAAASFMIFGFGGNETPKGPTQGDLFYDSKW